MSSLSVSHKADTSLFYAYLALLAWIPLPLGSNRPWAICLMSVMVFALLAYWLILHIRQPLSTGRTFSRSLPVLGLLLTAPLWAALQLLLDISIDPANTLQSSLSGFALTGLFSLTLLMVRSQRRIKLLCYVLVGSGLFQALYGSMMTLTGIEYLFFVPKDSYIGKATGTFVNRNHLDRKSVV